jgi:hypothetical protein
MLATVPIIVPDCCAFAIDNGKLSTPTDTIIAATTVVIAGITRLLCVVIKTI